MDYAILGPKGTFSEEAANLYWGDKIDLYSAANIPELFALVDKEKVKSALVPIENSLAGSIKPTLECLLAREVSILGEISISIKQCLLAAGQHRLEDIELLISPSVVLQQCRKFIENHFSGVRIEITESTAKAAEILTQENKKAVSIGNRRTAMLYNLEILEPDINNDNNETRFIHISQEAKKNHQGNKTSICFNLPDKPGALYKVLGVLANRRLNLCKIESFPNRDEINSYSFYIEIDTHHGYTQKVLEELNLHCKYVKHLGSYNAKSTRGQSGITEKV